MLEKRINAARNETKSHFIFRNVCALITVIIAFYFVYDLLGFNIPANSQEELADIIVEDIGPGMQMQGLTEVLDEDYGIHLFSVPQIDLGGIFKVILCIVCVVACFLSNWVGGGFSLHFYRTSVVATCLTIGSYILSSTMTSYFFRYFFIMSSVVNDVEVSTAVQVSGDVPQAALRMLFTVIILLCALIPAFIGQKKGYSFIKFYVLSLFFFIPMLIISIIIGDKYEEKFLSDKGIKLVLGLGLVVILFPKIFTFVDNKLETVVETMYPDLFAIIKNATGFSVETLVVIIVFAIIAIIPTIIIAFMVVAILNQPITALAMKLTPKKNKKKAYAGKNARYVNEIMDALPVARKYKTFFAKRDRLAAYRKLDIDGVMRISVIPTVAFMFLCRQLLISIGMYLPFSWAGKVFPLAVYGYSILFFYILMVILSVPIAKINSKRADKMDDISGKKGYMSEIRSKLPDFARVKDESINYKSLCYMKEIFKISPEGTTPERAAEMSLVAKEGVALAKIVTVSALTIGLMKNASDSVQGMMEEE